MTLREKQIDDFANSQADCKIFNVDLYTGITLGAKWADKHPNPEMVNKQEFIKKVRNWLEKHTNDDKYWTSEGDELYLGNLIGDICKYLEG